jgi:alpha-glucoside transport system permease protein
MYGLGASRQVRLTMARFEVDDGFGGLGPVVGRVLRWLPGWVLILFAGVWLLPMAAGFVASVRPWAFGRSTAWWVDLLNTSTWTLEPYRIALGSSANGSFGENMLNSFAIAIPATLVPLLIGSAAAYALVWIPFRGSGALFLGIVVLIAVPVFGLLIPILQAFVSGVHLTLPVIDKTATVVPVMGLVGSIPGVWIVLVGTQLPFAIFLLVYATAQVPRSLIDSARMDGATAFEMYRRVVIPLTTPTLAALGVLLFLWSWNDFVVALTILGANSNAYPATVRFSSLGGADGPVNMAMVFIHSSVALAVFLGLQRYFVRGLTTGTE